MTGPLERAFARAQRQSQIDNASPSSISRSSTAENAQTNEAIVREPSKQPNNQPCRRKRVQVSTLSDRFRATKWMVDHAEQHGEKHIATKCVKQFPALFSGNQNANIMKAMRWWRDRGKIIGLKVTGKRSGAFSMSTVRRNKRIRLKAMSGRGRKRAPWVFSLYKDLREEFERLRSVGVKFNTSLLLAHAKKIGRRSRCRMLLPSSSNN